MGYHVYIAPQVVIPAEKVSGCLQAINALFAPETLEANASGCSGSRGVVTARWYAWCSTPPLGGFTDLVDAFAALRYTAELDKFDQSVHVLHFRGQKLGDDEFIWTQLAPYVEPHCQIDIHGEDDQFWRWDFEDGKLIKRTGRITYE